MDDAFRAAFSRYYEALSKIQAMASQPMATPILPHKHFVITDLGHEQAVSEETYVSKRKEAVEGTERPMLGDDPNSLTDFRRVFATWDFSEGTY